ncbi:serine protease [Haliea sp. E1-2-M8]|uniref:trypsin-like serine peptidase n=1 Tax=Haliea sp. E1-2-M8 TaxID=3064706 RepID=UPI0027260D41|nr:serine protease [Haliea sp. E1-2-M8]MDO8860716.1 serine protease [Haliea sp. E1-2-M8]
MTNMLGHSGEIALRTNLPQALLLLLLTTTAGASEDSRLRFSQTSPDWLRAVGQLTVPGIRLENGYARHHTERCSATLVAAPGATHATVIVSAWHCLEFYRDLTQRITFTLLPASAEPLAIEAVRYADGGSMEADWAVLRLRQPVALAQVPALQLHPQQANPALPVVMAGYSRDAGTGAHGEELSYDPACRIIAADRRSGGSDCRAFKGASGGAVVQLTEAGAPLLSGVISEGNSVDYSRYVPVSVFRQALPPELAPGITAVARATRR